MLFTNIFKGNVKKSCVQNESVTVLVCKLLLVCLVLMIKQKILEKIDIFSLAFSWLRKDLLQSQTRQISEMFELIITTY